ncbi:metal ABC transporter permease, partial [Klebsiella pneumoniae]|uniref:metal ABC transporter permease n=1 Tax=Klebsiella pneumoniae TaxID=573 RepID=UPI0021091EC9
MSFPEICRFPPTVSISSSSSFHQYAAERSGGAAERAQSGHSRRCWDSLSALVGGVCAFLSCYLMLKGWSLIGDA